jgi:hypothetical protein
MKKTGLGLALLMSAALLGAQTARIQEISGTVEVKTPGAAAWQTAEAGQVLDKAALISTGFKSTALVRIGNSAITVRPLTRLSLEDIAAAQNEERVTVNLRAGRIKADVKPPPGGKTNFTVRSPIATASVRGTVFDFDGIHLRVEEGRVYLGAENAAGVYISTGHTAAADAGTGQTAPVIETIREALIPALPAGVDTIPVVLPPAPSSANLEIWVDWSGL